MTSTKRPFPDLLDTLGLESERSLRSFHRHLLEQDQCTGRELREAAEVG
jgi:hypothetical protein